MGTLFEPYPATHDTPRPQRPRRPAKARTTRSTTSSPPRRERPPHPQPAASALVALRFDPFPLWLAERRDGSLQRTPCVAVEEGRVRHANAAARQHGITHGMRVEGARLRVGSLHVVANHEPDLAQAWAELLAALSASSPWLAPLRRGLVLLRLPAIEAEQLAQTFSARAGIAADRHSAELASATATPGTPRRVAPGDEDTFLERLPLRFLRTVGLSDGDLTRLHWLGLRHAGDLARWSAAQVRGYLGATGAALLPYLHGPREGALPRWHPPVTLQRQLDADPPLLEPHQLTPALSHLADGLVATLGERQARLLSVEVTAGGRTWRATRRLKRPLATHGAIVRQAQATLGDSGVAAAQAGGSGIETLRLTLGELQPRVAQGGLWAARRQREEALDAVSARFNDALVGVHWGDPHAPASDQAWRWHALDPATTHATPSGSAALHDQVPLPAPGTASTPPWSIDGRVMVLDAATTPTPRRSQRDWPSHAEAA